MHTWENVIVAIYTVRKQNKKKQQWVGKNQIIRKNKTAWIKKLKHLTIRRLKVRLMKEDKVSEKKKVFKEMERTARKQKAIAIWRLTE